MAKKITIVLLVLCQGFFYAQSNYYFSSSSGNDTNVGNEANPFQTIAKLNSLSLVAGDKVLFKRGDTFIGQIIVSYSGSYGSPIIYDSYGTGDLPTLTASDGPNGIADPTSTIKILAKEYIEFQNLKIENERFDSTGVDDDKSFGIYMQRFLTIPPSGNFEDRTLLKHYKFSNLIFQNIYSANSTGTTFDNIRTSGIHFFDAFINDVIIEDCYFNDIERCGIWLRRYVSDAVIRNNKFIDIGGSATIVSASKRVLYENNLMRFSGSDSDPRMTARGSGMWVFGSDDVVAQYNVSQHARGSGDSSGMHVDYGNTNILYQYNYLEDSSGGFCETLGDNNNVIWRYNISVNEGTEDRGGGQNKLLWVSDYAGNSPQNSQNVYIYNNTLYQGLDYQNVISNSEISLKAVSLNFINNIIYLEPSAKLGELAYLFNVGTPNFAKNVMYGGTIKINFKNLDATKIIQDPLFIAPGRRHFSGYKLLAGSPALGSALSFTEPVFPLAGSGIFSNITSNATKDIYGNSVNLSAATNIGADNGYGESNTPSLIIYEAESGVIVGGNEINCANASGGKAVNIQNVGQTLTFSNINVVSTDLYLINIFYANPNKSTLKTTVNSGEKESMILPYSDAYCYQSGHPTSFPIIKTLNSGLNSIVLEEGIIDKIEVVSINDAALDLESEIFLDETEAHLEKTYIRNDESVKLILNKNMGYGGAEISIFDMNGVTIIRKKFNSKDISIDATNLGTGLKILVAQFGTQVIVKKFIVY